MMKRINTEDGEYVIYQATESRESLEGDVMAGDWLYQPSEYQGDPFSPSYPTEAAAEQAARDWADQQVAERNAD